nr:uncharacterized protein LOC109190316 [Ipomoea batatas]
MSTSIFRASLPERSSRRSSILATGDVASSSGSQPDTPPLVTVFDRAYRNKEKNRVPMLVRDDKLTKLLVVKANHFVVTWDKPPQVWLKLNVDAAIDNNSGQAGFGFIPRDAAGSFIAAREESWKGLLTPKLAEALAIRSSITWLKSRRCECMQMQIETDALSLFSRACIVIAWLHLLIWFLKDVGK